MQSISLRWIKSTRPLVPGTIAGLTAGWAIFGLLLAIDTELGLFPGAFYKMIGLAFGVGSSLSVYFGFLLHMVTAVAIGITFIALSYKFKILYINSVIKGIMTGIITGIVVWGVFFLPINFLLMQPALQNIISVSDPSSTDYMTISRLLQFGNNIVFGSLALHVVFGGIMGFCGRLSNA